MDIFVSREDFENKYISRAAYDALAAEVAATKEALGFAQKYWMDALAERDALTAEVAALRDRVAELEDEARWVSVEEGLPEHANKKCEVRCKHKRSNKAFVTVAVYVAPRSIRADDFIDPDYSDSDWEDYEEETDTYWTPTGWYEATIAEASDVNWFLSDDYEITHWRYITPPEAE